MARRVIAVSNVRSAVIVGQVAVIFSQILNRDLFFEGQANFSRYEGYDNGQNAFSHKLDRSNVNCFHTKVKLSSIFKDVQVSADSSVSVWLLEVARIMS